MKFDRGLIAVVLICTLVFTTLTFSQDTLFNDGYYHIQFANQMKSEIGLLPQSLPNIYYSVWNTNFADKHYLYHLVLKLSNSGGSKEPHVALNLMEVRPIDYHTNTI